MSSASNLCKQFGPRSGPTNLDITGRIFENVNFEEKNKQTAKHFEQSINLKNEICDPSKYIIDHPHSIVSKRMVESISKELFAYWEIFHDFCSFFSFQNFKIS